MIKKIFIIFIITLALFFCPTKSSAFSISPLKYFVTIDAGTEKILSVTVKNNEADELTIKPVILGARQNDQGAPIFLKGSDNAEGWIKTDAETSKLSPGQDKKINFIISVPKNSPPGTHFLGLGVEKVFEENSAIGLSGRLLTILELQVAGIFKEEINIENWDGKNIIYNQQWPFDLQLKNIGNAAVPLSAKIIFNNWRGDEIVNKKIDLGSDLLPQSQRKLASVAFLKEIKWPGLYQVQIKLNYGVTRQEISALARFWYLPIWSIGLFIIIIILLGLIYLGIRRK